MSRSSLNSGNSCTHDGVAALSGSTLAATALQSAPPPEGRRRRRAGHESFAAESYTAKMPLTTGGAHRTDRSAAAAVGIGAS